PPRLAKLKFMWGSASMSDVRSGRYRDISAVGPDEVED
ncbi:unnamed protein product, partial [marine sediment metagenome]